MMDKKPPKCRFRVMMFEENAISSSKNEITTECVQPAKSSRGSRDRERRRSPDPQVSIKDTITTQDRKSTRTVSKIPIRKIILNKRPNTITGELKQIFSSTNYPELNSAHQVGDKAKKTKKKAKGKRKKSNLPDHFRRYEDTVNCESRRTRTECLRYEQKRITPSMYYLSAGDSIEREIREPKATDESCHCLPAEITCPTASHYKDSLSSRNSRRCSKDCTIWMAGEGKNLPICHCSSLNINVNRYTKRRDCICSRNKSGVPVDATSTTRPTIQNSIHVDCQTCRLLQNNASRKCQTLHKNSTSGMFDKSAQPSKTILKLCSTTNTADIGCKSRTLAGSKNVTIKSPSSYMNSRSRHRLIHYKCVQSIRSDPSCQCRKNATCCRSSNWTFKGRNSLTAGTEAQCLAKPTIGSVTETPKRRVSVHTHCPALRSAKRSASTMTSLSLNLKAAYHKFRTAVTGTGDAPLTIPACACVQTGGSPASRKLGHSVPCPVDDETDCNLLLRSLSEMPTCISCGTSYLCCSKIPRTTQCEATPASPCEAVQTKHETGSDRPCCNISCGSFPALRTLDCGASPISVLVNCQRNIKPRCLRMRKKACRCKLKIIGSIFKIKKISKKTSLSCADAETDCLNDSCHDGPRRVQPIFTGSTWYFSFVIHVIAMIVLSPFLVIIYFCRFVTSPIRPSGNDCGKICPTCIPPKPCTHALFGMLKSRKWFDKPTVCSHAEPTTCRVSKTSHSKFKKKQSQKCNKCQFQKYYSQIFCKPRSRRDHKKSRCNKCSKPASNVVRFCNPPSCEEPSPCSTVIVNQITPCQRSNPTPRPCLVKKRPCRTRKCKGKPCQRKSIPARLRCYLRRVRCYLKRFWKKNKPKEPTLEDCIELSGPYFLLPPPPYYMYDPHVWRKSFFRGRPKPKDCYYYCIYFIAGIFWCPLGLCLFITYKSLGNCVCR